MSDHKDGKVLKHKQAVPEDQQSKAPHIPTSVTRDPDVDTATKYTILDLYETRDENRGAQERAVPFYHELELRSCNETAWAWGHFDNGAMVDTMSTGLWEQIRETTSLLMPSLRRLRMANGLIVIPLGCWRGIIQLAGIEALVSLEVFDSAGGWELLFGKNLMQTFGVIHNYSTDGVTVNVGGKMAMLTNGHQDMQNMSPEQRAENWGGRSVTPVKGVSTNDMSTRNATTDKIPPDNSMEETQTYEATCEVTDKQEVLIEMEPTATNSSLFTRKSDPFKPARIMEIPRLVQVGTDLLEGKHRQVLDMVMEYVDVFAMSVSKVKHVKRATHTLHIKPTATFSTKVHKKPLTPAQKEYLNKSIDDMLAAGIIERCDPAKVKCVSLTTLAQKAHAGKGLSLEEL
ncbi:hypothetical protein C0991_002173 [Blastosporella zonata]|nr:hypothetical protein C0991_002173 [Blastosporella zonata]